MMECGIVIVLRAIWQYMAWLGQDAAGESTVDQQVLSWWLVHGVKLNSEEKLQKTKTYGREKREINAAERAAGGSRKGCPRRKRSFDLLASSWCWNTASRVQNYWEWGERGITEDFEDFKKGDD